MIFTLEDLLGLRSGRFAERQVGELQFSVLERLGWRNPIVYLSRESLAHIGERHPDISDFELLRLPEIISFGMVIRENAKPHVLTICYQAGPVRICVILKKAPSSMFDIWVTSVRRLRPRQTKAMLARGSLIRAHK